MERYGRYITTLQYNATARRSLRIDLYDLKNTIEDETIFLGHSCFQFRKLPLLRDCYSTFEKEIHFFYTAACLCYVPYDRAGYAYYQEKLGGVSVADYRYDNILRKLKYMGIQPDEQDQAKLHRLLLSQETGKITLDPAGIAGMFLRVRCALEGEAYAKRGGFASLTLKKAFSAKLEQLATLTTEANLEEIDITPHLPAYSGYCLTEKDKAYLDFLFDAQAFPALYEYTVDVKEYCRIDDGKVTSFLRGGKDKDIQVGDKITVTFDNLQISATVTGIRLFADFHALPNEPYGFGIGSRNPYFYDNETVRAQGGLALVDFAIDEPHETKKQFTVLYHAHQLAGHESPKEMYLIKKETPIYRHVGYASPFLLKECQSGKTLSAVSPKPAELVLHKDSLLSQMSPDIPSIPTRKEIENGCFTSEDYTNGIYLIKLEVKGE